MFSARLEEGYSSRPAGPLFMLRRPCYVPPKLRQGARARIVTGFPGRAARGTSARQFSQ
ncbi:hypothetical protein DESPIG_02243 [Desulfovibrio piger ATCC 29098]|uniref:Uncharacterized protein n=1 Tax=Desulfovibrio piger ATCC 29098 TaxID=411464 RepID=B6WVX5_9BACT|nr:hypothetical protein DESPIG_02243 [Desulfovibrio piger ATCC 29098]